MKKYHRDNLLGLRLCASRLRHDFLPYIYQHNSVCGAEHADLVFIGDSFAGLADIFARNERMHAP